VAVRTQKLPKKQTFREEEGIKKNEKEERGKKKNMQEACDRGPLR